MAHIHKIVDLDALIQRLGRRPRTKTVVLTNGAFDLLHVGHVRYLQGAKTEADTLVVAINSDTSVQLSKGPKRPIIPAAERAELVAALEVVDWVLVFDERTAETVIQSLQPDVHAKGTDYNVSDVPEGALVRSYGGRVAIVGDEKCHSTSETIEIMRKRGIG